MRDTKRNEVHSRSRRAVRPHERQHDANSNGHTTLAATEESGGLGAFGRMSIDEDELLKLLKNEVPGEDSTSAVENTDSRSVEDDVARESSECFADLERELSAALNRNLEEENSELRPVTPEDVKDVSRTTTREETVSSGRIGKESSSTDGSSVEGETCEGKRVKRKAETGSKSPMKKTKYYETNNTVRKPGWAEDMLKNRPSVMISQKNPAPSTTRAQHLKESFPMKKSKTEQASIEPIVVGNGYHGARRSAPVSRKPMIDERAMPPGWLDCPGLEGKWGIFLFSKVEMAWMGHCSL